MPLHVLIVDDEPLARSRLRTLLADCRQPAAVPAAEAASAVQAMERLQRQPFDAVLLDIHMPGANGIDLARAIRQLPAPPAIIFVTAHTEHALQAFELDAADYLTKPVRLERLENALQKAALLAPASRAPDAPPAHDTLLVHETGRTERVPIADVLYLKAELKYVTARTATRSHILDESLAQLEARFGPRFLRIHRNALVARQAIRTLERRSDADEGEIWAVRLDGCDEWLTVSRRQVAAVREALGGP